jgi:hypothetical protein
MFKNSDKAAFLINVVLLVFCMSSYPFQSFFITGGFLKIYKEFAGKQVLSNQVLLGKWYNPYVVLVNTFPFIVTLLVPQMADVLGMAGSVVGLFVMYIVPVLTYQIKLRNELEDFQVNDTASVSGDDDFQNEAQNYKEMEYYKECVIGGLIVLYGVWIFVISFYNPFGKD